MGTGNLHLVSLIVVALLQGGGIVLALFALYWSWRRQTGLLLAKWPVSVGLVMVLLMGSCYFYTSPWVAGALTISDSVEYALGAVHWVESGRYFISVNGVNYPPRYSPWFSIIFLAPSYWLCGLEIGNAIWPITIWAVLGLCAAYLIGLHSRNLWGAVLASVAVLVLPEYRYFGRQVMTDVPFVALSLMAMLLWLEASSIKYLSSKHMIAAGCLIMLAVCARPMGILLLLPWGWLLVKHFRLRGILWWGVISLPSGIIVVASTVWNILVFGAFTRTGYHFWLPVPYESWTLTFPKPHWELLLHRFTIGAYQTTTLLIILVSSLAYVLRARGGQANLVVKNLLLFMLMAWVPVALVHGLYFYEAGRLMLPLQVALTLMLAIIGSMAINVTWKRGALALLGVVVVIAISAKGMVQAPDVKQREVVEQLDAIAPDESLIVSDRNAAYLEYMLNRTAQRTIVPWSRSPIYANQQIARQTLKVLPQSISAPTEHRSAALQAAGAEEVFPRVASEGREIIEAALDKRSAVLVDLASLTPKARKHLKTHWEVRRLATNLVQVLAPRDQ